jgi:hypothetical protein
MVSPDPQGLSTRKEPRLDTSHIELPQRFPIYLYQCFGWAQVMSDTIILPAQLDMPITGYRAVVAATSIEHPQPNKNVWEATMHECLAPSEIRYRTCHLWDVARATGFAASAPARKSYDVVISTFNPSSYLSAFFFTLYHTRAQHKFF